MSSGLHIAVKNNWYKGTKILANATTDINLINSEEDSALHIVMKSTARSL
ncbi:MAG: hypothetical protein AB8V23_03730 [Candidatus Midichloria sp.]